MSAARLAECEGSRRWSGLSVQWSLVNLVHLWLAVLIWLRVAPTVIAVFEAGAGSCGGALLPGAGHAAHRVPRTPAGLTPGEGTISQRALTAPGADTAQDSDWHRPGACN